MSHRCAEKPRFGYPHVDYSHWMFRRCRAWWPFNNDGMHRVYDVAPRKRNMSYQSGMATTDWAVNSQVGWTLSMRGGTNDYVFRSADSQLSTQDGPMTYCQWLKVNSGVIQFDVFASFTNAGDTLGWLGQVINTSSPRKINWGWRGSGDIRSTSTVTDNTWNHITFWRRGTVGKIYINGKETNGYDIQDSLSNAGPFSHQFSLGRWENGNFDCPCSVSDVRIYDRALTEREIWTVYSDPWQPFRRRLISKVPAATSTPVYYNHLKQLCGQN